MTTTANRVSTEVQNESEQLEKASEHYKMAAHHYHEASTKQAHGQDGEVDHLVRRGAAHALHAQEHAEHAALLHASGVSACSCKGNG